MKLLRKISITEINKLTDWQGGAAFEILSCQGTSANLNWKLINKQFIKRQYEKDVKGYCITCDKIGKLCLPKDEKQSGTKYCISFHDLPNSPDVAYLVQPYLVLQIFVGLVN